ncbi:cyclopropane-fatty-acyl-phospholipid synthase-like protein [Leptotrombidium deliense]|uniref:Cyclopropane-fatty-acyl-phospholipid synthase-like protein n=1 Tax=Leptotrombidium deliense TaxID=299467 RepID=A0A443SA38_9ACAR|nr:cyclopropane-fatty-acyl-phospholipid synthase-like protein [Leptotrombidium deliense]
MPLAEPWTTRYIFSGGMMPYYKHITQFSEGLFVLEDWQNFGHYYHLTLKEWNKNFVKNWHRFSDKFDENFYRMWVFYLNFAAGAFRARRFNLWQIVFSKNGLEGGYEAVR